MANQTVPELNPITSVKNTDLIEITVDNGDTTYTSYRMAIGEFKKAFAGYVPERLTFTGAETKTYTPTDGECVVFAMVFDGATIEITKTIGGDILLPSTDSMFNMIGHIARASLATNRRISVTSNMACVVDLITIKSLYF